MQQAIDDQAPGTQLTGRPLRNPSRRTRRAVRLCIGVILAITAVTLLQPLGASAQQRAAGPRPPSKDQVQQAKDAAAAAAQQVARLRAQLATAQARQQAADDALGLAAEAYDAAQIALAARTDAARQAAANATQAVTAYQQSQVEAGLMATQVYMNGSDLSSLDAFLAPGGPGDLLDRLALVDQVSAHRAAVLQRLASAQAVARLMQRQAQAALSAQQAAAQQLAAAERTAQQAAAQARAVVAAVQAQQTTLLSRVAALTHTSLVLQRQRQAWLDAQQQEQWRRQRESGGGGGGGGGGGTGPAPSDGSSNGTAAGGEAAVAWAKHQVGLPYQWGGAGPDSYDCSGLTMRAWEHGGVGLPHYAASQYAQSAKVPYAQMRPGDLIFYATDTSQPATIHHVTMFIGDGMMIEAPATGLNVRIVPIRWRGTMAWAGRP